jgi:gas vesicle protein
MRAENRNFLIGTIIGAVVGGAAAILLAPATGEETRQRLRQATEQAREKAKGMAAKGREYVQTKQSQFQEAVEAGRHAAEEKRAELEKEVRAQT